MLESKLPYIPLFYENDHLVKFAKITDTENLIIPHLVSQSLVYFNVERLIEHLKIEHRENFKDKIL